MTHPADVIEVSFDVTREDWVRANEIIVLESPSWEAAAARHRRSLRRQALLLAPTLTLVGAMVVGNHLGPGTQARLVGAGVGAAFGGALIWALPRLNFIDKQKRQALEHVRRADLSDFVGPTTVAISPQGALVRSRTRELRLAWDVAGVARAGEDFIVHCAEGGAVVPRRAFASDEAAAEFLRRADEWWAAGQLPPAQRLERYLADREVACPRCRYPLRAVRGEWCPECGFKLSVEELVKGAESKPAK